MRTVGLVTEYNPFHNGHLHHLLESLKVTGADASVAVMSGHFLQRGEPALVDKWVRTEMALAAGVDLVFELPFAFACNSAPHFALGAVQSLNALGVIDTICFGSEAGELELLERVAAVLVEKEKEIEEQTAAQLRRGVNYPTARSKALGKYLPKITNEEVASPNNILGIEYLRALRVSDSSLQPYTIKRIGAGYHDMKKVGGIASATGIRKMLAAGNLVGELMPTSCHDLLQKAIAGGHSLDRERLYVALQAHLLSEAELLEDIYLVSDGLERRLALAALEAKNFDELALQVKSRQWTLTRIQRTLIYVLIRAISAEMQSFMQVGPLYLRLLGNSEKGRAVLARARKRKSLPIISDPARATSTLRKYYRKSPTYRQMAEDMLRYDLRATQLYGLLQRVPAGKSLNQDYYQAVRQV